MALAGNVLEKVKPAANTEAVLFTCPSGKVAVVNVLITNTSGTTDNAHVAVVKNGTTPSATDYIVSGATVLDSSSPPVEISKIVLEGGDSIVVKSSGGNLLFSAIGVLETYNVYNLVSYNKLTADSATITAPNLNLVTDEHYILEGLLIASSSVTSIRGINIFINTDKTQTNYNYFKTSFGPGDTAPVGLSGNSATTISLNPSGNVYLSAEMWINPQGIVTIHGLLSYGNGRIETFNLYNITAQTNVTQISIEDLDGTVTSLATSSYLKVYRR